MESGFAGTGEDFVFMRAFVPKLSPNANNYIKQPEKSGAGGGTRTRTTFYGPRILSPARLPFRHTGNMRSGSMSLKKQRATRLGHRPTANSLTVAFTHTQAASGAEQIL